MDSILRDGLCTVGLLYLVLHLWHSMGSIRKGIANSGMPAARSGSSGRRYVPDPHDHLAVGTESRRQGELSRGGLDGF